MALPSSGAISISNVNTEVGAAANAARGLDWLKANSDVASYSLNAYYSKKYYAKTTSACGNGNCTAPNCWTGRLVCNCGDCGGYTFSTCSVCAAVTTTTTTGTPMLQSDCNTAAGSFNCNVCVLSGGGGGQSWCNVCPPNYGYNGYAWITDCANCNCNCCFAAGTMVVMSDGTLKAIEDIVAGDILLSGAEVVLSISSSVGNNTMWEVNFSTVVTGGHLFKTNHGWAAIDASVYPNGEFYKVDLNGEIATVPTKVKQLNIGDQCGDTTISSITELLVTEDFPVYNLVLSNNDTFKLANGLIVDGFAKVT